MHHLQYPIPQMAVTGLVFCLPIFLVDFIASAAIDLLNAESAGKTDPMRTAYHGTSYAMRDGSALKKKLNGSVEVFSLLLMM